MVTKTINLKMVLDRSDKPEAKELRQALWTTHEEINKAVAKIEEILLLCRGRSYLIPSKDEKGNDTVVTVNADDVQKNALTLARSIQQKTGKPNIGTNEEVLKELQQLYHEILSGDSQEANKFASPLMDKESKGLMQIFEQIPNAEPEWVAMFKANNDGYLKESEKWLKTEQANILINGKGESKLKGRKAGWLNKLAKSEPWQESFIADQEKKRKQIQGAPELTRRLKAELFLLPLLMPPILSKFLGYQNKDISPWDRLALRLAVAHILSWESWNELCSKEWGKINKLIIEQKECLGKIENNVIKTIRQYESERHEKLKKFTQINDDDPFKINSRMLRGYDKVKNEWSKKGCLTKEDREHKLDNLQAELKGKFGDPDLYNWLAEDENKKVWQSEENPLLGIAKLNGLEKKLKNRKPQALMTFADSRIHPRWSQFEKPGGTNIKSYEIIQENNELSLNIPLIKHSDSNLTEKVFPIRLATSGQINEPEIKEIDDTQKLLFFHANEQYAASFSGSDILFDRPFLENRELNDLQNGNWGKKSNSLDVWFKLVLDIEPKAPQGWLDNKGRVKATPEINHFKSGLLNNKHLKDIEAGLRVLTLDLGIRAFASCSVFELVKGKPAKGLCWPADKDKDLWAKHERSFVLKMPGEDISNKAQLAREEAYKKLSELKQGKYFLKELLRLSVVDKEKRKKELEKSCSAKEKYSDKEKKYRLTDDEKKSLEVFLEKPLEVWKIQLEQLHKKYEPKVSKDISDWRKQTKPKVKDRQYEIGKSYWGIKYLEDIRDFLKGWSTHGRQYGQINQQNREKRGVFANNLLEHINNKKEDRIKTGVDLIIQAARGKIPVYNERTKKCEWKDRFQPCRLILFEDLNRYRFHTDRPRRENAQLMRWSHRKIVEEAKQQSTIYGIHIDDRTGAEFSSRFYAKNGCPGVRATKITDSTLKYISSNESLRKKLFEKGINEDLLKVGNIVPWEGGEFFVSFDENSKVEITHADINAAQNLQRRYWTRYVDTFRVKVENIRDKNGKEFWVHQDCGARLLGGLSKLTDGDGFALFKADGEGFVPEKIQKKLWSKITGKKAEDKEESGIDELDEELIDEWRELESEESKDRKIFFRDASGLILKKERFYSSEIFWSVVNRKITKALVDKYKGGYLP
ncbi:MAG: type V CRISPR-associated protein Cas12b [Phycisphaerae bacterium]|nr:type V CRISPR-associated protein Cas12b [Phycisphaerae bacterium]